MRLHKGNYAFSIVPN